jgi:hypothetical protein
LIQLRDADSGKPVLAHAGSVYWNDYRKRWVFIVCESFGTSVLGETWYAEADTPLGPWVYARKIVTHDTYSFYNPKQHAGFAKDGGRIIYFEGTYTSTFSGSTVQTPRYDYNQIMYKLDLSSPKLALPAPIYCLSEDGIPDRFAGVQGVPKDRHDLPIAFFAPDLPGIGTISVYQIGGALQMEVRNGEKLDRRPAFYALPADMPNPPATTVPLYEFVRSNDGRRAYTTDVNWSRDGFTRSANPICLVWKNPMTQPIPLNQYAPAKM